jgi:hypothetical protein
LVLFRLLHEGLLRRRLLLFVASPRPSL